MTDPPKPDPQRDHRGGPRAPGLEHKPTPLPARLATPAVVGGLAALYGTYWDDAWHTDRGRDDFFIAPHLVLYGGVLVVAVVVGLWWRLAAGRSGWVDALRSHTPLRWAVIAATTVFASAPVDNAWHLAYGRDAVLFSPPHLLAIAASASLMLGVSAGLVPAVAGEGTAGRWLRAAAGALVLGSLLVPVMEYEADVPQFAAAWYLPLVAVAVVLARPVAAVLLPVRWPLTAAAAVYTVVRAAIVVGLATSGFSTPIVPPILVVALVADVAAGCRCPWPVESATIALAVHIAYVPWLGGMPHGVPVQGGDLALSFGVSLAAAIAAGAVVRGQVRPSPAISHGVLAVVVLAIGLVAWAQPVSAHDPGQGERRGMVGMTAAVDGTTVRLDVSVGGVDCRRLGSARLIARRAGMTRHAELAGGDPCRYEGRIDLPEDGRWFAYAVFDRGSHHYEAWLPVEVGGHTRTSATRDLYESPARSSRATEFVVGALLVAVAAVVLHGALRAAVSAPDA